MFNEFQKVMHDDMNPTEQRIQNFNKFKDIVNINMYSLEDNMFCFSCHTQFIEEFTHKNFEIVHPEWSINTKDNKIKIDMHDNELKLGIHYSQNKKLLKAKKEEDSLKKRLCRSN